MMVEIIKTYALRDKTVHYPLLAEMDFRAAGRRRECSFSAAEIIRNFFRIWNKQHSCPVKGSRWALTSVTWCSWNSWEQGQHVGSQTVPQEGFLVSNITMTQMFDGVRVAKCILFYKSTPPVPGTLTGKARRLAWTPATLPLGVCNSSALLMNKLISSFSLQSVWSSLRVILPP